MTTHAEVAKAIRQELKKSFPNTSFRVRSKSFSGGDDVSIDWTDGPTVKEVDSLIGKYQYGHFNGMEDIYEYSNSRKDIPQTKYLLTSRGMSDEIRKQITEEISHKFAVDMTDEKTVFAKFGCWSSNVIYREFSERSY